MEALRSRIQRDGKHLGNGILKVDSFMNHQIDPILMREIGQEFAKRFKHLKPTRILTAETSGIAPALSAAMSLEIPVVFARKHKPVTMGAHPFRQSAESHTHGRRVELLVSPEYLTPDDRILLLDDFLATARTIKALVRLIQESGATLVGIGAVIEKSFEGGRAELADLNIPVESLAVIEKFDGDQIILSNLRN
ncbi:MAG: xanthine phosphoribosyltransferase [Candidatus Obscuribacterales bacterium]|nr:xanthine phosphoribosyltransferase [Candidatus Obscuribacterales bacterium]